MVETKQIYSLNGEFRFFMLKIALTMYKKYSFYVFLCFSIFFSARNSINVVNTLKTINDCAVSLTINDFVFEDSWL